MFRKFGKGSSRGSITVFVTLMLVPTIALNSFLVDIARLKLYGNQAAMTADNYGEAVLSVYDNLLKDLYGLFAISQNEEGKEAIEALGEYMKTSFDPNQKAISSPHVSIVTGGTAYSGFMPYKGADIELSYAACKDSSLRNEAIFSTQIGDFMRFRIVQPFMDGTTTVLQAVESIKNQENDAKVIKKKSDFDEVIGDLLTKMQEYYQNLKRVKAYPEFLDSVVDARRNAISGIEEVAASEFYQNYKTYRENESSIKASMAKRDKGEELTEADHIYLDMYYVLGCDGDTAEAMLREDFESYSDMFELATASYPIDFDSFDEVQKNLVSLGKDIKKLYDDVQDSKDELEDALKKDNITDELKKGIEEDLKTIDALFEEPHSASVYKDIADHVKGQKDYNKDMKSNAKSNVTAFEKVIDAYLNLDTDIPDWGKTIDTNRYDHFYHASSYKIVYDNLEQAFEVDGEADVKNAKDKKKAAEEKQKEAENALSKDEPTDARDIPDSYPFGSMGSSGSANVTKLIDSAASYFGSSSLGAAGNRLMLKFYTVVYDTNMFSSRVTNIQPKSAAVSATADGESDPVAQEESLTGYELSKKINYLYGAELEYLLGGFKSSQDNLNEARNKILAFRAVVNFTATYQISEINAAIKAIASAASVVNPALGWAVSAALRASITALETYEDWKLLVDNDEVVLIKTKLTHLSAGAAIGSLISIDSDSGIDDTAFKMGYKDYITVMLLFLTTTGDIAERTEDLIELNVNTVLQNVGADGTLSERKFKMDSANTAVDATCAVQIDFAVIPDSMANMLIGDASSALLWEYEKNKYAFRVTRGY